MIMCATKSVKSSLGEKFSVDEKEVLLIRGIKKVPGNKKKKVMFYFLLQSSLTNKHVCNEGMTDVWLLMFAHV